MAINRRNIFQLSGLITLLALVLIIVKHYWPEFGLGLIAGVAINYFLIEIVLRVAGFNKTRAKKLSTTHTPYQPPSEDTK